MAIPGFIIYGPPRTKKTSNRIVQIRAKGGGRGFTKILPSKAHEVWHREAMKQAMLVKTELRLAGVDLPLVGTLNLRAMFYRERLAGDATGFYQAIADLLQDTQIIVNDSQIASWDGSRLRKDAAEPRIECFIEVLQEKATERELFEEMA